jgi:hypothetical protein
LDAVADGHGIREPVDGRSSADVITSDLVEGVEQGLRYLKRDQQRSRETLPLSDEAHDDAAVILPQAAAWLSGSKAKLKTPSYQLADA